MVGITECNRNLGCAPRNLGELPGRIFRRVDVPRRQRKVSGFMRWMHGHLPQFSVQRLCTWGIVVQNMYCQETLTISAACS
jgi:hypothetical protein